MKRYLMILVAACAFFWIPLNVHADNTFYGKLEIRPEKKLGRWTIGWKEFVATKQTIFSEHYGPLLVGACLKVDYENTLIVHEIGTAPKEKCGGNTEGSDDE